MTTHRPNLALTIRAKAKTSFYISEQLHIKWFYKYQHSVFNFTSWPPKLKYVCSGPLQEKFTLSCFTLSWYFLPCNPKCPLLQVKRGFYHACAQAIPATPNCHSSTVIDQLPCTGSWNTNQISNPPRLPPTTSNPLGPQSLAGKTWNYTSEYWTVC